MNGPYKTYILFSNLKYHAMKDKTNIEVIFSGQLS